MIAHGKALNFPQTESGVIVVKDTLTSGVGINVHREDKWKSRYPASISVKLTGDSQLKGFTRRLVS